MTTWFSPGRIEVLGKHTDYAGGRSMIAALDRGVTATVTDADAGATARSTAMPDAVDLRDAAALPSGHWGNYIKAAFSRLELNFGPLAPCTIEIDSTLPLASGMSSSSAVVVASALALAHHNGLTSDPRWTAEITSDEALATYLACVENGSSFGSLAGHTGVGTRGGSEDHTAMICSRPDELGVFSFTDRVPARLGTIAFPEHLRFVVVMSGVLAEKTGPALAQYNRSSELARAIVAAWNQSTGRSDANIGEALRRDGDARADLTALVAGDPELARRLDQFLVESQDIIPAAADALAAGDLSRFGDLVDASQRGADQGLGNQIDETRHLAAAARRLGAHAASAFGAGYGGSVWALVDQADADAFAEAWLADYLAAFPEHGAAASVLVTRPKGGVREAAHLAG